MIMVNNYIYLLDEKIRENNKIGSTIDFINRMACYVTSSDNFDNKSHNIYCYKIIDATINNIKLNCYQIDKLIQLCSQKINIPFTKYNGTGGIEFYKKDNYKNLNIFFDKLNFKYEFEKIDVDKLRKSIKLNNNIIENNNNILLPETLLNYVLTKLSNKEEFKLKPYQKEICDVVKNHNERLCHLIVAPTGCGKTVIFTKIICDQIKNNIKNNKDIMIITKRKDILENLDVRIESYIDKFIDNNITNIKKSDYNIIKCIDVNKCNLKIINQNNKIVNIYIVNWDKLTSSDKTDYHKINWNKFGLLIIDESHWCGADNIYDIMKYIKNNTQLHYLGFSATPVRCDKTKQINTLDIFGNKQEYNVIYEYSYYSALKNKDICPIKYYPIFITENDIIKNKNDDNTNIIDSNSDNNKQTKKLKKTSYLKVWNQINNEIISKLYFKKGIIYFRNRTELFEFYNEIKAYINIFNIFISVTINNNDNSRLKKLIEKTELNNNDFENAIKLFLKKDNNAILFVVYRASEGFDDDKLDFAIRLYYSDLIDPLNEMQRMGRLNRYYENKPCDKKECAYFVSLELNNDTELLKQTLLKRLKSWIEFIRGFNKSYDTEDTEDLEDLQEEKEELKKLIEIYSEIIIKNISEIDIEKDIINDVMTVDINYIKYFVRSENNKRYINKIELLDTSKKIKKYIEDNKLVVPVNINNWLQFGFSDKIYKEIVKKYYNLDELKEYCKKNNINNLEKYNIECSKNIKLPSIDYFDSGFYRDNVNISLNLNLNILFKEISQKKIIL